MTNKGGNVPSNQVTRGFDNSDIPASTLREVKKLNRAAKLMAERQSKPRNCKPIILKDQRDRKIRNRRKFNSQ
jgi:hypothetical protein